MVCLGGMGRINSWKAWWDFTSLLNAVFSLSVCSSFTPLVQTTHPQPRSFHKQGGNTGESPHMGCVKRHPRPCVLHQSLQQPFASSCLHIWRVENTHTAFRCELCLWEPGRQRQWDGGRTQHPHMHVTQLNSSLLFPKTQLVGSPLRQLSVSPKQKCYHCWPLTMPVKGELQENEHPSQWWTVFYWGAARLIFPVQLQPLCSTSPDFPCVCHSCQVNPRVPHLKSASLIPGHCITLFPLLWS